MSRYVYCLCARYAFIDVAYFIYTLFSRGRFNWLWLGVFINGVKTAHQKYSIVEPPTPLPPLPCCRQTAKLHDLHSLSPWLIHIYPNPLVPLPFFCMACHVKKKHLAETEASEFFNGLKQFNFLAFVCLLGHGIYCAALQLFPANMLVSV